MTTDRPRRILHLIGQPSRAHDADRAPDPDAALRLCSVLIRTLADDSHSVFLIGGSRLEACAAAHGLNTTDRVAPPLGRPRLARAGLRALMADRGAPDLVHCWGHSLRGLASGAGVPVAVACLESPPGAADTQPGAATELLIFNDAAGWSRATGLGTERLRKAPAPRCGVALHPADRRRAKHAIGATEKDTVVLLIGGEPGEADGVRLLFLAGLLAVCERPAIWLAPASASRLARAQRGLAMSRIGPRLVVMEDGFNSQLAAADVGVWLGGASPDGVSRAPSPSAAALIGAAIGAGVPVVAPRGALLEGLYPEAAAGACLAFNGSIAEVARCLVGLVEGHERRAEVRASLLSDTVTEDGDGRARAFAGAVDSCWRECMGARATAYAVRP